MGGVVSKSPDGGDAGVIGRAIGITGGGPVKRGAAAAGAAARMPSTATRSSPEDYEFIEVRVMHTQ